MKLVKKFAVAVIFVSVLAVPAFASDLDTPGKTTPPPPPPTSIMTTTDTVDTAPVVTDGTTTSTTDSSYELLYEAYMAMLGLY